MSHIAKIVYTIKTGTTDGQPLRKNRPWALSASRFVFGTRFM